MENKSLAEYENIKEFLELLDYHDMNNEKKQLEFIIDYVDSAEKHFNEVLQELKDVKNELHTIQNKTIKAAAIRTADNITVKFKSAKHTLLDLKQHIKNTIDKGLKEFKEKGKDALTSTMEKLNIKGMLQTMKNNFDHINQQADKEIDHLTKLGDEIHAVNHHFKNIGRAIMGKQISNTNPRNNDKGMISHIQNALFHVMDKMTVLSQKAQHGIEKIEKRETEVKERHSVKQSLHEIKKNRIPEKSSHKEVNQERG